MIRPRLGMAAGVLSGVLLLIALLYPPVAAFTFSAENYRSDPPYDAMAQALIDYLSGKDPALPQELFTERERLHMEDVLRLYQGGRALAAGCAIAGLACLGLSGILSGRRRMGTGLLLGIAVFFGVLLLVAAWAAIDFEHWFRTMHELVFTNDLWLLDPEESMLIRMMPLDFFSNAVGRIALYYAVEVAVLLGLACLCRMPDGKRRNG